MAQKQIDSELLRAALAGYEFQKSEMEAKIAEIRRQLGGGSKIKSAATPSAAPARKRRKMGAAARKRIAAAQKKRWAAFHAGKDNPAKPVAVRAKKPGAMRKMSAEGRKRIIEATKKRWAAVREQKAAGMVGLPLL